MINIFNILKCSECTDSDIRRAQISAFLSKLDAAEEAGGYVTSVSLTREDVIEALKRRGLLNKPPIQLVKGNSSEKALKKSSSKRKAVKLALQE